MCCMFQKHFEKNNFKRMVYLKVILKVKKSFTKLMNCRLCSTDKDTNTKHRHKDTYNF